MTAAGARRAALIVLRQLAEHAPTSISVIRAYIRRLETDTVPAIETDAAGEAMICDGCGTTRTLVAIRRASPRALSCCPERKMLPARHFWRLALELQRGPDREAAND